MTTVTSSDRGDTGSTRAHRGARSSTSDIPGQRAAGTSGGQTLRILVLGGGDAADELRRQAAEAGAELAQRFSARVTHVVVEPGLAGDDPRVAKALAADLPVLTLAECVQLLGFCEATEVGEAGEVGSPLIPAQTANSEQDLALAPAEAQLAGSVAALASVDVDVDADVDVEPAEDVAELLVEEATVTADVLVDDAAVGESAVDETLVDSAEVAGVLETDWETARDSAAEVDVECAVAAVLAQVEIEVEAEAEAEVEAEVEADVTEDEEVGEQSLACAINDAPAPYSPTEAMFGSALEAALLFPPMPISPGDSLAPSTEYQIDSYAKKGEADDSGQADELGGGSVEQAEPYEVFAAYEPYEVSAESKGDALISLPTQGGKPQAEESAGDVAVELDVVDVVDVIDVTDLSAEPTGQGNDRARLVASYAWAAVPFASLGLLTPIAMGYAAYRQRSRALAAVASGYLLAVSIAFIVSAASSGGTQPQSAIGDLLTVCLAASWIGGTVHALLIRRQVFGRPE